jgi:hypothetical protein
MLVVGCTSSSFAFCYQLSVSAAYASHSTYVVRLLAEILAFGGVCVICDHYSSTVLRAWGLICRVPPRRRAGIHTTVLERAV